jgi:tryptophan 2,3-dioxygenase
MVQFKVTASIFELKHALSGLKTGRLELAYKYLKREIAYINLKKEPMNNTFETLETQCGCKISKHNGSLYKKDLFKNVEVRWRCSIKRCRVAIYIDE